MTGLFRTARATALTSVVAITVLVPAVPSLATTSALGSVTVQPATGTDLTSISLVTSGPCVSGTNVIARVFGKGFPAEGQVVVSNSPLSAYQQTRGKGRVLVMSLTMRDFMQQQTDPVALHGTYRIVVTCREAAKLGDLGDFTGSLVFSSPRNYVAHEPQVPAASLVPVPQDQSAQLPVPTASGTRPSSSPSGPTTSASPVAAMRRASSGGGLHGLAAPLLGVGALVVLWGVATLARQRRTTRRTA